MKQVILVILATITLGCGSGNFDATGNATLQNGTVTGNVSVQTPLGTWTIDNIPPSP